MKFAGRISKFEVGNAVLYNATEGIVTSIGILGSKLSGFEFLYEVKLNNGNIVKVIDKALKKLSDNSNLDFSGFPEYFSDDSFEENLENNQLQF